MTYQNLATSCAAALLLLCVTQTSAMALDGYQDRRGLFTGVGVGGGVGMVESEDGQTGVDSGRKLGLHLSALVGGGVHERLTVAGEASWWARNVLLNDYVLNHHHLSFNALANLFLLEGIFLEGGGGLAYAIYDTQTPDRPDFRYQELGLSLKGGAGFEFFVNSQIAVGLKAGYTRHFYSRASFDTVAGGLTIRWY